MKREPVTIEAIPQEGAKPKRRAPPPNKELYKLSPAWQKGEAARLAALEQQSNPAKSNQVANATPLHQVLSHQMVSLNEVAIHGPEAARYLGAVASGRKKGEQWRMAAARDVLDRIGVTGSTVERAQIAAQAAAGAGADLSAMLDKLVAARQFAARKASATDAETGQTSGKPPTA